MIHGPIYIRSGNIIWKLLVLRPHQSEDFQILSCVRQEDKNEIKAMNRTRHEGVWVKIVGLHQGR